MEPTPGWKSSEFILTCVAHLVAALSASGAITNNTVVQVMAFIMATLAQLGYTATRGFVKSETIKAGASPKSEPVAL